VSTFPRVNRVEADILLKLRGGWWMPAGDDLGLRYGTGEYATGGRRARANKRTVLNLKHKNLLTIIEKTVQPALFSDGVSPKTARRWILTEAGESLASRLNEGVVPMPEDKAWRTYKREPRDEHLAYVQFCLWQSHRIRLFRAEIAQVLTRPTVEKAGEEAIKFVRANHFNCSAAKEVSHVQPEELALLVQRLYREVYFA
jgi:hypothetical protein